MSASSLNKSWYISPQPKDPSRSEKSIKWLPFLGCWRPLQVFPLLPCCSYSPHPRPCPPSSRCLLHVGRSPSTSSRPGCLVGPSFDEKAQAFNKATPTISGWEESTTFMFAVCCLGSANIVVPMGGLVFRSVWKQIWNSFMVQLIQLTHLSPDVSLLPLLLAQVEQHLLLQVILPVVDGNGIVVTCRTLGLCFAWQWDSTLQIPQLNTSHKAPHKATSMSVVSSPKWTTPLIKCWSRGKQESQAKLQLVAVPTSLHHKQCDFAMTQTTHKSSQVYHHSNMNAIGLTFHLLEECRLSWANKNLWTSRPNTPAEYLTATPGCQVAIQAMDQSGDAGLMEVPNVRGGLPRLLETSTAW